MRVVSCAILAFFLAACSRSPQTYLARGNAFYAVAKYSQAEFEYRVSIAKDPHFAEAYYRLALADLQLGRGSTALNALQQAVTLSPGNEKYAVKLADVSIQTLQSHSADERTYDEAVQETNKLLRKDPDSFDALRLKGELLIVDRKYDQALTELRKADAIRPLDPAADVLIVKVLFTENHPQQAESLGQKVVKAHPDNAAMYDVLASYYYGAHRIADLESLLKMEISRIPTAPGPRLQLARLYRESGRRQEMAGVLSSLADAPKRFPDAPRLLGDFYAHGGEWNQALQQYREGERSDAKNKQLYERRIASALAALGQTKSAVAELSTVLKANPGDASARLARAILLRDSTAPSDRNTAISDLKSLVSITANDPTMIYNLGLAYLANGEVPEATAELKRAAELRADYDAPRLALAELADKAGDYAGTVSLTEQVLANAPHNVNASVLHAAGLIGVRNYPRAGAELEALLKSEPDSLDVNLQIGALEVAEKKYAQAEELYLHLYKPGAADPRPLEALVHLYLQEMKRSEADALLQKALAQAPQSSQLHLLAAQTAVQEGNREAAIQQYEWLSKTNPRAVNVLTALGDLYRQQGDIPRAIAKYQKARQAAPQDPSVLNGLAILESDSGQAQSAIATLDKELALNPQAPAVMNDLAFNLAESGKDLDRAQTLATEAVRAVPGNPDALDTLAWVYTKLGLNQSAIQVLRILVKKNPGRPMYRYHLGVALLQSHQTAQAKLEFAMALSQNPTKDLADKIRQASARF